MLDALAIVTKIVSEHHAIKGPIKLAGDTVNDIEALFALQRTQSGWGRTSVTALVEKRDQLLQTISFLEEGLKNHFGFEEELLPPLLGKLLTKAILDEHRGILGQIGSDRTTLADMELEGLGQREETILNMIRKTLEKNRAR